ncbi:MAG: 50S ribosomal protein L28 [Parcubacteria group bacterium]|nr:50S ribosomal protein L28 [Parcubacteria group bacterium]
MARICTICGKKPRMGGKRNLLRGHYNPTKKVFKYPNLQLVRLPSGRRVQACTQCIKTLTKIKK